MPDPPALTLTSSPEDHRQARRATLPPMYTLLRAKRPGDERYLWAGHLYDISMTGMRFELDSALEPGETLQIRAMLPGHEHITVRIEGRVARIHDDEAGPVRMGLMIDRFLGPHDRQKLATYIDQKFAAQPAPMRRAA